MNSAIDLDGGVPDGIIDSQATALNDLGVVVGVRNDVACVWTNSSPLSFASLGVLANRASSYARSINSDGLVVGYAADGNGSNYRAFIYDNPNGYGPYRLRDLNDLIPTNSGWQVLSSAEHINDNGQITGYGTLANGEVHAFLLTPLHLVTTNLPSVVVVLTNNAGTNAFAIVRGESATNDLTVNYYVQTTTTNGIISTVRESVVIAAGTTTAFIAATETNGLCFDDGRKSVVTIIDPPGYKNGGGGNSISVPAFSVSALDALATEGGNDPAVFKIATSKAVANQVIINYTLSGTATNAVDYTNLTGTVTIPAGSKEVLITISPINDTVIEDSEIVILTLNTSTNASYEVDIKDAFALIRDNDLPESVSDPKIGLVGSTLNVSSAFIDGSLHHMTATNVTLGNGATISQNLYVPGTPTVSVNGGATYGGTVDRSGSTQPTSATISVGNGATLGHVVRRTDAITIDPVSAPPNPTGTVDLILDNSGTTINFSTLRDLSLLGGAGAVAVPPGTYGKFDCRKDSSFVFGVAGSTTPTVYNLQELTLNDFGRLEVLGPVIINVKTNVTLANEGRLGTVLHPKWTVVNVASGGVAINSGATFNGDVHAPAGRIYVANDGRLRGALTCNVLDVNNDGIVVMSISISEGNQPPVAASQSVTPDEDVAIGITLTGSDPDGNSLTYSVVTNPSHGSLSGTAPNLTYTPSANYNGSDSFTFKVNDGVVDSTAATVSITVTAVNDVPTLTAISNVTINEDAGVQTISLAGIGSGASNESQTLTVTASSSNTALIPNPTVNYISPNATGNLVFTPVANKSGTSTITVTVNDGQSQNNTVARTFTVTVNAVNDAPVFTLSGDVTVAEDFSGTQTVTVTPGTAPADETGQTVTYSLSPPSVSFANVSFNMSSGTVSITALANGYGTNTFTVMANDGQPSNNMHSQTFSLKVSAVNDAPTLASLSNLTINEDAGAQTVNLSGIGTGAMNESQTLSVTASSSDTAIIPNPNVTYTSPNTTGSLAFTPVANANGTATITVSVNDGQGANNLTTRTFTVTINAINDRPTLAVISNVSINEDAGAQTVNLSGIGTGANESQTLTVTAASSNTGLIPNPTVNYTSPSATGSLVFTPVANQNGTATITVIVQDDGGTANGGIGAVTNIFTVTVEAVNDAPAFTLSTDVSVAEDFGGTQTVTVTAGTVPADETGQTVTYSLSPSSVSFANVSINATSGTVSITAVANGYGTNTFTITANDGQSTNNTHSQTFTLAVSAVNDVPVANAQSVSTAEDTAKAITLTGSDVEGDSLSYLVVDAPSHGVLSGTGPNLTYTPEANYYGSDSFTFKVNDGLVDSAAAVISITVTPVNDAPVANAQSVSTDEDTAKAITLSGSDVDGDALTYSVVTGPAHGTLSGTVPNLTYTPSASYNGSDSFTFKVNDGTVDSAVSTVSITVMAINHAPLVSAGVDQTIPYNETAFLLGSALDDGRPQGSTLTNVWSQSSGPGIATFGDTNSAVTTVSFTQPGSYVLRLTVSDGDMSGFDELVITASANLAPVVTAGADQSIVWSRVSPTTTTTNAVPSLNGLKDTRGTNFWLTFCDARVRLFSNDATWIAYPTLSLHISGDSTTTGTIQIPGLGFTNNFSVTPGIVTEVAIPVGAMTEGSDVTTSNGIHVTAGAEISVYGLSLMTASTDAYMALPTDVLGTNYVVMTYRNQSSLFPSPSEFPDTAFSVVATEDGTTVTITLTENVISLPAQVAASATTHYRQAPFSVVLNKGQVYQLGSTQIYPSDLSGTLVAADKPVAVIGSHRIANVPVGYTWADHLVEQLLPLKAWGAEFAVMPLATRKGDTIRVVAGEDGTRVVLNSNSTNLLNRGQFLELIVYEPTHIKSDKPVGVFQYSNGLLFDHPDTSPNPAMGDYVLADPFMVVVPPAEQFLNQYTVVSLDYERNFIGLVVPAAGIGKTSIDGQIIPLGQFQAISGTDFYGANLTVTSGSHTLAGDLPFGITVYGYSAFDSYGYSGGMLMGPVALASDLSVTPQTGTLQIGQEHVLTAAVKDMNQNPLEGIRVDFKVTGENPALGFAITGTNGQAQYRFTGRNVGSDQILVTVGKLSVSASVDWISPSVTLSGNVSDDGLPVGESLSSSWTKVSGPGDVKFVSATQAATTASFGAAGTYVLRLTATDTQYARSDDVTVTVYENLPPVVDAGADQLISLADAASLSGSISDDSLPAGSTPTVTWTKLSGPGAVTFTNEHAAATSATFTQAGVYVLRLTGTDSLATSSDEVVVRVQHEGGSIADSQTLLNVNFGGGTRTGHGVVGVSGADVWNPVGAGTTVATNLFWYDGAPSPVTLTLTNLATAGTNANSDSMLATFLQGPRWSAGTNTQELSATMVIGGLPAGAYDLLVYNLERSHPPDRHGYSVTVPGSTTATKYTSAPFDDEQSSWINGRQYVVFTNIVVGAGGSATVNLYATQSFSPLHQICGLQIVAHTGALFPEVVLGADRVITLPQTNLVLTASVLSAGDATAQWTLESGPGGVAFSNEIAVLEAGNPGFSTQVTFTNAGLYVLRLTSWGDLLGASDTLRILVNRAPVAVPDSFSMNQGVSSFSFMTALQNDFDPDQDEVLSLVGVGAAGHGRVVLQFASTNLVYCPDRSFSGTDSFEYVVSDRHGAYSSAMVTVTVIPRGTNSPPVAVADTAYVNQDSSVEIQALLNDTDANGDSLKYTSVGNAAHGRTSLTLSISGGMFSTLLYVPDAGFFGQDSFAYTIDDGFGGSATGTVTVYVNPASNHAPLPGADAFTFPYASQSQALNVMANDSDPDGDAFWILSYSATGPLQGHVAPVTDQATGRIVSFTLNNISSIFQSSYTSQTASFSYTLMDAWGMQSNGVVSITVLAQNVPPIAMPDTSYSTSEDVVLNVAAPGVLGNDQDMNGDAMTAILVSGTTNGTVTLNSNGSFTYVPNTNSNGSDRFTYKASDGALFSFVVPVIITVAAVNDAPSAVNDAYSVNEDTVLTISAPGVRSNDTDVEGSALTATLVSGPAHGMLTLNANGSFSYLPSTNFIGTDSFTYEAFDGTAYSAAATVTITVNPVNDPPSFTLSANVTEDEDFSGSRTVTVTPGAIPSDEAAQVVVYSLSPASVSFASVTMDTNAGTITITSLTNKYGSQIFTVTADDQQSTNNIFTQSFTLTINPVNDAPVATNASVTLPEDATLTVGGMGVLIHAMDPENDPLTVMLDSDVAHGTLALNGDGTFTYEPNQDFNGTDSFTYQVSDGALWSLPATFTLTVTPVNDPPTFTLSTNVVAVIEDFASTTNIVVTPNSVPSDEVSQTVTYSLSPESVSFASVTINPTNGLVSISAVTNAYGTNVFTVIADDGQSENNLSGVTFQLEVAAVNDAPVAVNDSFELWEDGGLTVGHPGVLWNDPDAEGDSLTVALVTGPAHGVLTLNTNGSFVYLSATNYSGSDSFTYQAIDSSGLLSNEATVNLTVTAVNDPPLFSLSTNAVTLVEDFVGTNSITVIPAAVPSDEAAQTVTYTLDPPTSPLANVTINPTNGLVTITAVADAYGTNVFWVIANDGQADNNEASALFTLTVTPVNDVPVAVNDAYTIDEDTVYIVPAAGVLYNDPDPDDDDLTAFLVNATTNGIVTLEDDGSFTYIPNENFHGTDSFTYRATDGVLTSAVATVTITINPVNDDPFAQNDSFTLLPGNGPYTLLVLANDTDVENDTLTITGITQATNGVVARASDSLSVTFTPNAWFAGHDRFYYVISDGQGGSSTGQVDVLVWRTNNILPAPQSDLFMVDQKSTGNVLNVLANDSDPDGDILRVASLVASTNATVTLNLIPGTSVATNVLYTPNTNFFGIDQFRYTVTDGTGGYVSNVLVTVFVRDTNSLPPFAVIDFQQLQQDSGTNLVFALGNDFDLDGDELRIYSKGAANPGQVLIASDGSLLGYVTAAGFFGIDSFAYTITDDRGGMDTNRVHIFVNQATNTPLVAYADNVILQQDDSGPITINVLTNDFDLDGDSITLYYVYPPNGGSFSTNANAILYTPNSGYYGVDVFYYAAHDGNGGLAFGQVNVYVNRTGNTPPTATNDTFTVTKNSVFNILDVRANDTDATENNLPLLVYDATPAAHGSVHVALDGTYVAYSPAIGFLGSDFFTYYVADTNGGVTTATVTLTVIQGNTPPVAFADTFYVTENDASTNFFVLTNDTDADGDALTILGVATNTLGTVTITSVNGTNVLSYAPPTNTSGSESFRYTISDGHGGTNTALVKVYIRALINTPPVATNDTYTIYQNSLPTSLYVLVNDSDVDAGQSLTIIGYTTPLKGTIRVLNNDTVITYQPDVNISGTDTFTYTVHDGYGGTATATVTVNVTEDATLSPVAYIHNLTNHITVREGLFELIGTATDPDAGDPVTYQVLLYRPNELFNPDQLVANVTPYPRDENGWHVGGVAGTNSLGNLDFTMVRNGAYDLVLVVKGGNKIATADRRILLNSNLKIGQFTFSQQDLVIPVNGFPLTVVRTYDSLNPDSGDFGHAWTWALNESQVELDEFRSDTVDAADDTTFSLRAGGGRNVTLTLPDGRRTTFEFYFKSSTSGEQPWLEARYRSPVGVFGKLGVMGDNRLVTIPLFPPYWAGGDPRLYWEQYDFPGFYYTNRDGTVYVYEREDLGVHDMLSPDFTYSAVQSWGQPELTQILQRSGDRIVLDRNNDRVKHYNAAGTLTRQIVFQRDAQHRVIAVTDPKNQDANGAPTGPPAYSYTYDGAGNLSQVHKLVSFTTGQNGATNVLTTTYVYGNTNFPHYITQIIDPRGKTPLRTFYDDQGRLSYTVDANGKTNTFSHNLAARSETITDRLGNESVHLYDARGNVTESINALGEHTLRAYDDKDNVIAEANDLGHTTAYAYDLSGNRTAVTNALGHVVRMSYDAKNQVTSVTDAKGNTTYNTYDYKGNLTTTKDAQQQVSRFFYDNDSRLTGQIDPLGNRTTNVYNSVGDLSSTAHYNAQGAQLSSASFGFDLNGRQIYSSTTRTLPNNQTETITSSTVYDEAGQAVSSSGPDNLPAYTIYNEIGKLQTTIDKVGRETQFVYDDRGHTVKTIYPDLTFEGSGYDDEGRRVYHTNRLGKVTQYLQDALGRMTNSYFFASTGAVYQGSTVFDRAGRVFYTVNQRGTVSVFGYDDAGRRTSVTNGWGTAQQTVSQYVYDANGNQTVFIDALGHGTTNVYDTLNRRVAVWFHDGTSTQTIYDQGGRRVWERDQANVWTGFGYDGSGRMVSVTNAMGTAEQMVTRYEYDEVGNQTAQIDAKGNTTRYEYNALGQRVKRTLPGNQFETYAYNALGSLTNRVDFKNKATAFIYDAMNRLIEKRPAASLNETSVTYGYDALGLRTGMVDSSGTTAWAYDERQRLVSKTVQWYGQQPITLTYTNDEAGLLTGVQSSTTGGVSTGYAYDELNRLTQVSDLHSGVTSYAYNAVGSLAGFMYTNGVWHSYQYDALNRLTNLMAGKATSLANYAYTLGPTGNRLSVTELTGRAAVYDYDALYRLKTEVVVNDPGNVNGTVNYGFDAVGNRTGRTSTITNLANQSFSYNANDWLNSGVDHTYDANGNTTIGKNGWRQAVISEYDFENRLVYQSTGTNEVIVTYDGDGNRVRKIVIDAASTNTTYYLVDSKNLTGYAQVLEEYTAANFGPISLSRVYGYGHDLISQHRWTGTQWKLSYYGYDGHGSVRFLTDSAGNLTDTYEFDAFGNLIARGASSTPTPNLYLYTGEQFDPDLGFYYLRARYNNPDSGRFWTMDSYEGRGSDPMTLHKYLYCHANPLNGIDPSGNFTLSELQTTQGVINTLSTLSRATSTALRIYNKAKTFADLLNTAQRYYKIVQALENPSAGAIMAQLQKELQSAFGPGDMSTLANGFTAAFTQIGSSWGAASGRLTSHLNDIAGSISTYVFQHLAQYVAAEKNGTLRTVIYLPSSPFGTFDESRVAVNDKLQFSLSPGGGRVFGFGLGVAGIINKGDQLFRLDYWDTHTMKPGGLKYHYHVRPRISEHNYF